MKKLLQFFILLFASVNTVFSQNPMYFNQATTGAGNNVYPFGNATVRKVQWRIPANSLGTVGPGNNITAVYFLTTNNLSNTFPVINIKLKQNGNGMGGGGVFETGMTTVYSGVNVTKTGIVNGWGLSFTLTTPFLYDPSQPLIVEAEQNSTSTTGPYIWQTVFTGPGQGRQWGDYNQANYTGTDGNVVHFGIDVIPNTPCSAVPGANSVSPASYTACPGAVNPMISPATSYSFGGITYQWQSSTTSSVGPFTSIPGATFSAIQAPTIATTTWFQVVATCTNAGGGTTTLTPSQFVILPTQTTTVPFYESFESIPGLNKLPNCSWWSTPNLGTTVQTYTSSNTLGRFPRTGSNFASFFHTPAATNYVYTNGMWMDAGVTYSASMWYQTEYYGYNNWTDLSLLVGPNQSPTGLTLIKSTNGPAVSNVYKSLSNTFTVPTSGLYYVAVKAVGTSGNANYLTWDDLAVDIPCSLNSPTMTVSTTNSTVCQGQPVSITATGADTYTWSTGDNGASIITTPLAVGLNNIVIWGSNALSGCTTTITQVLNVLPAPDIFVYSNNSTICSGQGANLVASGATSYAWSSGGNTQATTVFPVTNTTYSVIGTNAFGCSGVGTIPISVNQLPTVAASSNRQNLCIGESVTLTGSGAQTYQWLSSAQFILLGNPLTVSPTGSGTYTLTGTDANGCSNTAMVTLGVDACTGINQYALKGMKVYPNPTNGDFTIELNAGFMKTIEVLDLTGRVVLTTKSADEKVKLNTNSLPEGIYSVKVYSNDAIEVIKLIKE